MSQISQPSSRHTSTPAALHPIQQPRLWLQALWKFSRPHTIIGTSLSVATLFVMAIPTGQPTLIALVATWIACLCGNVYIVGLNQLEDIDIDRINKPQLPLASGEFSRRQGQTIVTMTGILALMLAWWQGPFLLATVASSLAIGTAYSLPPIRLKRFPFWASVCIFTVRGVIVNLGLFLHFQGRLPISPQIWALTLFILGFTFAIAILKDIPDMEGDRYYNISTLTLRLGARAVFKLARWVITLCYGGLIAAALLGLPGINPLVLGSSHLGLLGLLWWRSHSVDLQDKRAIAQFYQFIWKLFFLEYLVFALACLL